MEQNHNMLRGISENGGIVFYGVDSTEIVREMERLHKTSAVTTAAPTHSTVTRTPMASASRACNDLMRCPADSPAHVPSR